MRGGERANRIETTKKRFSVLLKCSNKNNSIYPNRKKKPNEIVTLFQCPIQKQFAKTAVSDRSIARLGGCSTISGGGGIDKSWSIFTIFQQVFCLESCSNSN